jgi:hypothetical protein
MNGLPTILTNKLLYTLPSALYRAGEVRLYWKTGKTITWQYPPVLPYKGGGETLFQWNYSYTYVRRSVIENEVLRRTSDKRLSNNRWMVQSYIPLI